MSEKIKYLQPESIIKGLPAIPKDLKDALIGNHAIFNVARDQVCDEIPKDGLYGFGKKVLEGVISFGLFPSPSSTKPESYDSLLDFAQQVSQLERDVLLNAIEHGNNFGLVPYELKILVTSCQLGQHYDQLCKKVRHQYQVMEKDNDIKRANEENNSPNPYAVLIKSPDGQIIETPYSVAYPDEIQTISLGWKQMVDDPVFQEIGDEHEKDRKALKDFFHAYVHAVDNTDPKMDNSLWWDVDNKFLSLNTRIQPIPGREKIYDDKRIFPDFRLAFKIPFSDDYITKTFKEEFAGMRNFLDSRYWDKPVYKKTRSLLNQDSLQSFDMAELVRSGRTWDFPLSAQSLPDDPQDFGNRRKIMTCSYLMKPRAYLSSLLLERLASGNMYCHSFIDIYQAVIIGGHELGEPIFETVEIKDKMDPFIWANLNEDRATLISVGTVYWLYDKGRLNLQNVLDYLNRLLGISLRYLQVSQGSEAMKPYRIMSLLTLRRMIDSGLLVKNDRFGWTVNIYNMDNCLTTIRCQSIFTDNVFKDS